MTEVDLKEKLQIMEAYLRMKLTEKDWHGVADAAMDIRELEAKLKTLKESEEERKMSIAEKFLSDFTRDFVLNPVDEKTRGDLLRHYSYRASEIYK